MNLDLREFSVPCACGAQHHIEVKGIWIEPGAIDRLPQVMEENGWKHAALVCDKNTYEAAGRRALELWPDSQLICLDPEGLHANEHGVDLVEQQLQPADILIAAGSGTVHDITRYVAYGHGMNFISIPTAASVDGFVSTVAAMTWKGCKRTLTAVAPLYVLADSDIFSKAPARLTASGVGDLLGKYTALVDWRIGQIVTGEYFCEKVNELEYTALHAVEEVLDEIGQGDAAACEKLMYGLLLSGLAMQMVGNSRPASGAEHHMSHLWEMEIINPTVDALHGEKVGVGLLLAAKKYHQAAAALRASAPKAHWEGIELPLLEKHVSEVLLPELLQENKVDHLAKVSMADVDAKLPQILDLVDSMPTSEALEDLLRRAGAPLTMEQLGLDPNNEVLSMQMSPYVRNRLTFMRLMKLWDMN